MVSEVTIPVMDQTTESVTLAAWLKQEGETVRQGDVICEIETDKANVVIEANQDGVLRKVFVRPGDKVPPRTVVALIADATEPLPEIDPFYRTAQAKPPPTTPRPEAIAPAPTLKSDSAGRISASPRARRLAEEHGIDLATIQGTGPDSRILEEDVRAAIEQQSGA